jgi:hypothetical protein
VSKGPFLWTVFGFLVAVLLLGSILGGIDHTTGHRHHYGAWAISMVVLAGALGGLIGRAAR